MANAGPGRMGDGLLERRPQLTALAGMLAEVRSSSSGRLVVVAGEAGVGKTALLRRFGDDVAGSGHVLWGACAPLRTPRPLGPLIDVAEATRGEFERVVTPAGRPHEVVSALLRGLPRRAVSVLVLEDLQSADEATIDAQLALGGADQEHALRQALEELRELGAGPAAAIMARRLRALGVRGVPRGPRPSTRENPAGLTTRELEVLALVAEGMRNAQIAERLIVSRKTVDHHVSAILRKLDAPTRGQAAATAIRLGRLQQGEE